MAMHRFAKDIATALVHAAQEENATSRVVADVERVADVFHAHPEAIVALEDRSAAIEKRAAALRSAFENDLHSFVVNALLSLQHAELLSEYSSFQTTVIRLAQEDAEHYEVDVKSAIELTDKEREKLGKIVQKKYGGTHRLHETVDPTILGGLIIDIGDWRLDASLKGTIDRLTHALST